MRLITTKLFCVENFNDITRGKEKGEAETYAARFMDRARNYDWNAADRFIANDQSTNRSARTRGVRKRRSSIRISNGARCSMWAHVRLQRVRNAWPSIAWSCRINIAREFREYFSVTFPRY